MGRKPLRTTADFETIDQFDGNIRRVMQREGKNPDDYIFFRTRKYGATKRWRFNAFYIGDLKGEKTDV